MTTTLKIGGPSRATRRLALLAALSLGGCSSGGPPAGTQRPPESPKAEAQTTLGPSETHRSSRLEQALAGLAFEGGRVRAVSPRAESGVIQRTAASRTLLQEGDDQLLAGRRIVALERFADAVLAAPELPEAYSRLGLALRVLGRVDEALAAYATALDLDPERLDALAGRARVLELRARFPEATLAWHDVLAHHPEHGRAHARLAVDWMLAGDAEAARQHLAVADRLGAAVPSQLRPLLATGQPPRAEVRGAGTGAIVVGPRVRIDTSGGTTQAAETSVAAAPGPNGHVVAAWNDLRDDGGVDAWSLGVGLSLDGGDTWTDFLLRPPGAPSTSFEGDPMTAYDPRTGYLWVGGVTFFGGGNLYVARKAPAAGAFEPVVTINDSTVFDKPWMAAGPVPGLPNSTLLHVAYNLGLQTSQDLGSTWGPVVPLDVGTGQLPRVGPGGELYVAYYDFDDGMMLQRSFDGGDTVGPPILMAQRLDVWDLQNGSRFPGRFRVPTLAYLAVDPASGTLYCVYFDTTELVSGQANVDLYFTRSDDQGATWAPPWVINGDSDPPGDQFFPWLEVDGDGRLHLIFFDTRYTPQLDDDLEGWFDVTYATSADGGDTWLEARLTPSSFSSALATWPGFTQFLGDFLGMSLTSDGILVAYPDTSGGDLDVYAQTVRLEAGIFSDGFESGNTSAWSSSVP